MGTVTKTGARNLPNPNYGNAPYGNKVIRDYKFAVNSSGIMTDSDKTTAIAAADVIRLGVLPAGMKLIDALAIVSVTFTDTSTFDLGFAYVDGVDSSAVPQDSDYFFAAGDYHDAAAVLRKTKALAPVTLPKDAYLILTNNTAAQNGTNAGVMDIFITGVDVGQA